MSVVAIGDVFAVPPGLLGQIERLVLLALADYANVDDARPVAWPATETLAVKCGWKHRKRVEERLKALETAGWIAKVESEPRRDAKGRRVTNVYELMTPPADWWKTWDGDPAELAEMFGVRPTKEGAREYRSNLPSGSQTNTSPRPDRQTVPVVWSSDPGPWSDDQPAPWSDHQTTNRKRTTREEPEEEPILHSVNEGAAERLTTGTPTRAGTATDRGPGRPPELRRARTSHQLIEHLAQGIGIDRAAAS